MDITQPRVDHRKNSNGVTGMNFPGYEFLLASSYKIFGFSSWHHRIFQFLIFSVLIIIVYGIGIQLGFGIHVSSVLAFAMAWSPELYYYAITALPDVMALMLALASVLFYLNWKKSFKMLHLAFLALCILLAGLIKLQYFMFAIFIVADNILDRKSPPALPLILLLIPVGGAILNWYIYAIELRSVNHLYDFGLFVNSGESGDKFKILTSNLLSTIPELLIGYALLPLVLLGLIVFIYKSSLGSKFKALLVLSVLVTFHILELGQMRHHSYYMLPYIFISALAIAFAARYMIKVKLGWLLVLLCLAQIPLTKLRIDHRFNEVQSELPPEFLNESDLAQLKAELDGSEHALVGPDPSGCIYFYYLGVKGYNAFGLEQVSQETGIQKALAKGYIEVIALRKSQNHTFSEGFEGFNKTAELGDFVVYKKQSL
ncbi:hypothetical protein GYB22_02505 [bacterium]|nr:hypothetical protein [bacterium]